MKKEVYVTATMRIVDFDAKGIVTTTQIGGSDTSTEQGGNSTNVGDIMPSSIQ